MGNTFLEVSGGFAVTPELSDEHRDDLKEALKHTVWTVERNYICIDDDFNCSGDEAEQIERAIDSVLEPHGYEVSGVVEYVSEWNLTKVAIVIDLNNVKEIDSYILLRNHVRKRFPLVRW